MKYLVTTARGEMARFAEASDATEYAKRKSKADKGAFTWRVTEAHTRQLPVACFLRGTVHA